MDEIFALIKVELERQDAKWGRDRILDSHLWMTILGEEFGEVCRASLEREPVEYIKELAQVAAVAISAIHSIRLEMARKAGAQ